MAEATPNTYDIGGLVEVSAAFADVAGDATDPTSVVCKVCDPLGVITTLSTSHDGVGNFSATVDLTDAYPGEWAYQFVGTGDCQAAGVQKFFVNTSPFA